MVGAYNAMITAEAENHPASQGKIAEHRWMRTACQEERNRPWTPEDSQNFLCVQRKLCEGLPEDFGPQLHGRPVHAPSTAVASAGGRPRP